MKSYSFPFYLFLSMLMTEAAFSQNQEGVYVISLESRGNGRDAQSIRLPADSIFVSRQLAIQKVLGINLLDVNGKSTYRESLETYYLIDLEKDRYKDIGKDLGKKNYAIPWQPLSGKKMGYNFITMWLQKEPYKTQASVFNGVKVKKISYTAKDGRSYEAYLEPCATKNRPLVLFRGLEDRFSGILRKMLITYPENKGSFTYTAKFVPLKNHEALKALEKLK